MRRFRFRLETALRLRVMAEQQAQAALGEAERGVVRAEQALTFALDERERHLDYCTRLQEKPLDDLALLVAASRYTEVLEEDVELRRADVGRAVEERDRRQEAVLRCRQERDVLEKLREKQYQEYQRHATAEEQAALDEMSVLRFGRA